MATTNLAKYTGLTRIELERFALFGAELRNHLFASFAVRSEVDVVGFVDGWKGKGWMSWKFSVGSLGKRMKRPVIWAAYKMTLRMSEIFETIEGSYMV